MAQRKVLPVGFSVENLNDVAVNKKKSSPTWVTVGSRVMHIQQNVE